MSKSKIKKKSLWENTETLNNKKYIILAGTNLYGRQLYLKGYNDCDDWEISAVPYLTTEKRCHELIEKATKYLKDKVDMFGRHAEIPKFELVERTEI